MARFTESDDLRDAVFYGTNLTGARFAECDLTGVVIRGSEVNRVDIDAPWLPEGEYFRINGVDVTAFVEAELDRRFPGRAQRKADDPEGLRAAWAVVEDTWAATLDRAARMPPEAVDVQVDGEWSFAQTLRHLVHATDVWFGKAVLVREQPFHPLGISYGPVEEEDAAARPSYGEVLEVRAQHQAEVRDFIGSVTPELLAQERRNPHNPEHAETVRSCLHVILEEEWEHHRIAVRDLEAVESTYSG